MIVRVVEEYKGEVILDIETLNANDLEEYETVYVQNTNLIEWYPFDKGAELMYDSEHEKVVLVTNGGSNPINHPKLSRQEFNRKDFETGYIPSINEANRIAIDAGVALYGLEDPEYIFSRADLEDAISHAFLVLNKYENDADLIRFYERNDYVAERSLQENAMDLELIGKLIQMYLVYRKVF